MSKIAQAFARGKAFIPFITCGDPDLETTAAAVRAAVENGADLIELGIPFSDPTAEGPVIQEANLRALKGGFTTDKIFHLVEELRKDVTIPLVFMTYAAFFPRSSTVSEIRFPIVSKKSLIYFFPFRICVFFRTA